MEEILKVESMPLLTAQQCTGTGVRKFPNWLVLVLIAIITAVLFFVISTDKKNNKKDDT